MLIETEKSTISERGRNHSRGSVRRQESSDAPQVARAGRAGYPTRPGQTIEYTGDMIASASAASIRLMSTVVRLSGLVFVCLLVTAGRLPAQEREVPKDSTRISIPGCARGRTFIVAPRAEHEPGRGDVEPGRRFRLSGQKKLLEEIKAREGTFVEVTGLVRSSQLSAPQGINIGGGVRVGVGPPRDPITSDPRRDPGYNEVVLDLESWRVLPGSCPAR